MKSFYAITRSLCLALALYSICAISHAEDEINKNGETMPATIVRTLKSLEIDTSSPFSTYISSYEANYGAPVLYKTAGINLAKIREMTVVNVAMFTIMAIAMGWTVIAGMNANQSPAEIYLPITYKILAGTVLFAKPGVVYALGMTVSALALTITMEVFSPLINEKEDFQYTAASFAATRQEAIDNSISASIQPANGPGSSVALRVYDAMAKRANTLNDKANFPTIPNNSDGKMLSTSIENAPQTMKMQTIQKNLSRLIGTLGEDTRSLPFVFYRVNPSGISDTTGRNGATSFEYGTSTYTDWQNSGDKYNASVAVVSIPPLSEFTKEANDIMQEYYQERDFAAEMDAMFGGWYTQDELNSMQKEAIQKYGQSYSVGVTNYLKATFWDNLKFASFLAASPPNASADYIQNYSEQEKQALTNEIGKLRRWYETTIVRSSGSASSQKDENAFVKTLLKAVLGFGTMMKAFLTYAVIYFYHAVMELYVLIIWLTYPLFFFKGTEKAFKGAVNVFFVCSIYPAASIFFFMIIDIVCTKGITFGLK